MVIAVPTPQKAVFDLLVRKPHNPFYKWESTYNQRNVYQHIRVI